MKKNAPKKVIARFTGKGFKVTPSLNISHSSSTVYTDREAYLTSDCDDLILEMLHAFALGIGKAITHPRIKPGSLRITFQITEQ